jgi:hypothetical protein
MEQNETPRYKPTSHGPWILQRNLKHVGEKMASSTNGAGKTFLWNIETRFQSLTLYWYQFKVHQM